MKPKGKRLAIIGSGPLAQQIAHYATSDNHYCPVGFYDDYIEKGKFRHGLPILGKVDSLESDYHDDKFDFLFIGVGYNFMSFRREVFLKFSERIPFGTIIHSSSLVDNTASVRAGTIIYPGCIVDMNVKIMENTVINLGCTISHDSSIGAHSFLAPRVTIAGFVSIGEQVNLGVGSVVSDNLIISSCIRTGASTTIVKNLVQEGLYIGTPAKMKT